MKRRQKGVPKVVPPGFFFFFRTFQNGTGKADEFSWSACVIYERECRMERWKERNPGRLGVTVEETHE